MTRRLRFADVLPTPPPTIVILAVIFGAVFASIGLVVDRGVTLPQPVAVQAPEALRRKEARTDVLLKALDREVSQDRSAVPTVVAPAPVMASRITPRRRTAPTVSAGIWSAAKERERESWRRWADSRLRASSQR